MSNPNKIKRSIAVEERRQSLVSLSAIGKQVWIKCKKNDEHNDDDDDDDEDAQFLQGAIIQFKVRIAQRQGEHDEYHEDDDNDDNDESITSSIVIEHCVAFDNGKQEWFYNLWSLEEQGNVLWECPHANATAVAVATTAARQPVVPIKVESCPSSFCCVIKVESSSPSTVTEATIAARQPAAAPIQVESRPSSSFAAVVIVESCSKSSSASANHVINESDKQQQEQTKRNVGDHDSDDENNAKKKKARVAIKMEEEEDEQVDNKVAVTKDTEGGKDTEGADCNQVTINNEEEEEEEFSDSTGNSGDDETAYYDVEEMAWFKALKTAKEKEKVQKNWMKAKEWIIDQLGLGNAAYGTGKAGLDRILAMNNNNKKNAYYTAPASFEQVLWLADFLFPTQQYYYRLFHSSSRPGIAVRQALRKKKERHANDPLVSWHQPRKEWLPPTATVLVGIVNVIVDM
jgi:hypothetical protein